MSSQHADLPEIPWRRDLLQDGEFFWGPEPPGWRVLLGTLVKEPSYAAVFLFRLSARLDRHGHPLLSLLTLRANLLLHGCEISPRAEIGPGLRLPHPYGVVVGSGVRIGAQATLFQHVTLGDRGYAGADFPTLGEGVVVFANSVVLGAIRLGDGCRVGAGSVVLHSVPAGTTVAGSPAAPIPRDRSRSSAIIVGKSQP